MQKNLTIIKDNYKLNKSLYLLRILQIKVIKEKFQINWIKKILIVFKWSKENWNSLFNIWKNLIKFLFLKSYKLNYFKWN